MKEKWNNRKFLLVLIAVGVLVVLLLFAFLMEKSEAKVRLEADEVTLTIGESWEIPVKVDQGQTIPKVTFVSENAAIASVTDSGLVTAAREGKTRVTGTTEGGQKLRLEVTVGAEKTNKQVIYLTFENGPGREVTPALLDLLKKYDAKATFFPLGQEAEAYREPVARAAREGHTVGVHTYSGDYSGIYASRESYMEDFEKTEKILRDITGTEPEYWRFPGGSLNENLGKKDKDRIMKDLHRKGFVCVDWNCYVDDLSATVHDAKTMKATGIRTIDQAISMGQLPVVRMYDSSKDRNTVSVTRKILKHFGKKGYEFRALSDYEGEDILAGEK